MFTSTNGRNTPLAGHLRSLAATTVHTTLTLMMTMMMMLSTTWSLVAVAFLSCSILLLLLSVQFSNFKCGLSGVTRVGDTQGGN